MIIDMIMIGMEEKEVLLIPSHCNHKKCPVPGANQIHNPWIMRRVFYYCAETAARANF